MHFLWETIYYIATFFSGYTSSTALGPHVMQEAGGRFLLHAFSPRIFDKGVVFFNNPWVNRSHCCWPVDSTLVSLSCYSFRGEMNIHKPLKLAGKRSVLHIAPTLTDFLPSCPRFPHYCNWTRYREKSCNLQSTSSILGEKNPVINSSSLKSGN